MTGSLWLAMNGMSFIPFFMSMKKAYDVIQKQKLPILSQSFCIVNKVNKQTHDKDRVEHDMYLPKDMKVLYLYDLDNFNLFNPSH